MSIIADKMELSVNYPRIFVLDFISDAEKDVIKAQVARQSEEARQEAIAEEEAEEQAELNKAIEEHGEEVVSQEIEKLKVCYFLIFHPLKIKFNADVNKSGFCVTTACAWRGRPASAETTSARQAQVGGAQEASVESELGRCRHLHQ